MSGTNVISCGMGKALSGGRGEHGPPFLHPANPSMSPMKLEDSARRSDEKMRENVTLEPPNA